MSDEFKSGLYKATTKVKILLDGKPVYREIAGIDSVGAICPVIYEGETGQMLMDGTWVVNTLTYTPTQRWYREWAHRPDEDPPADFMYVTVLTGGLRQVTQLRPVVALRGPENQPLPEYEPRVEQVFITASGIFIRRSL